MEEFVLFLNNLVNYYPAEYVILWLLCGLGVAIAKFSSVNAGKSPPLWAKIFVGIPLGIVIGLIIITLWPAYVVGTLFRKL